MRKLTLALIIATITVSGCSSHDNEQPDNPYSYQTQPVQVPVRLSHEFYNSWGHDGRGGAAMRKPTYQHVMGSEDMVMTTQGNYKDLRSGKGQESVLSKAMTMGADKAVNLGLSVTPVKNTRDGMTTSLNATDDEYLRAYRKFCQGATMTMTEREWEIVALGGPKNIPAALRGKCMHSK